METSHRSPKRAKPTTPRGSTSLATVELEVDSEIRKGKYDVGDCVVVSHNDDEYVALVSSLQSGDGSPASAESTSHPTRFTGIWYFRPDDVAKEALGTVDGGVFENEVFLSVEKDTNGVEHIVGKCQVVSELDMRDRQNILRLNQHPADNEEMVFVCRYKYDMKKQTLSPLEDPYEVRHGLGRNEPSIGYEFQADNLPPCTKPPRSPFTGTHVWSPSSMNNAPYAFKQFIKAVDSLRYGIGAIVKLYVGGCSARSITTPMTVHVSKNNSLTGGTVCRGIVCNVVDKNSIIVCAAAAGGVPMEVFKETASSALTDDRAMGYFHECRRDCGAALEKCTTAFRQLQVEEKALFRRELQAHLAKSVH
ncbi:hypothetical protein DYB32_003683 [Aphanomyces invadans]|uniref:BAH domain-containing protein n=1 Tax=Aphanomyces invadans TaxID=157072 RepID=A0A418AZR7_9STRA|nr:hypothetical protein DYB32_003683 [Aphanomyces invadans]